MRAHRVWTAGWVLAGLLVLGWLLRSGEDRVPERKGQADFAALVSAWSQRSVPGSDRSGLWQRQPAFPRDHAAHDEAPAETWELLVRLHSGERPFAVRIAISRLGALAATADRGSRWAARHFYRSQVNFGDLLERRSLPFERYARDALDLSGSETHPPRVWVAANELKWERAATGEEVMALAVRERGVSLDLTFSPVAPIVGGNEALAGDKRWRGYVLPRSMASGRLVSDGKSFAVSGEAWFNHAWGPLPPLGGQLVFDRWLLMLDDGSGLNILQTRRRDGSGVPIQQGIQVDPEGTIVTLAPGSLAVEPVANEHAKARRWRLVTNDPPRDFQIFCAVCGQTDGVVSTRAEGWVGIEVEGGKLGGWGYIQRDGQ